MALLVRICGGNPLVRGRTRIHLAPGGSDQQDARLDDGSDLSAKTKRIIYARWPLLEANF